MLNLLINYVQTHHQRAKQPPSRVHQPPAKHRLCGCSCRHKPQHVVQRCFMDSAVWVSIILGNSASSSVSLCLTSPASQLTSLQSGEKAATSLGKRLQNPRRGGSSSHPCTSILALRHATNTYLRSLVTCVI